MKRPIPRVTVVALASLFGAAAGAQTPAPAAWHDPVDLAAETMPLAASSLLLGLTRSGDHFVAVGERGHVLLSDDGRQWRQAAEVPTRATLTAVTAIGDQVWAVGHDGVILHSSDAGEHWRLQRRDPWQAGDENAAARDPRQGALLLGVLFTDARNGYAVGAYSLMLKTQDGGETWTPVTVGGAADEAGADEADGASPHAVSAPGGRESSGRESSSRESSSRESEVFTAEELQIGQESDPHFNAIARTGSGALIIVGERGAVFRSRDGGANWQRQQLPYDGSMFGVLGYDGERVLAFGLRGHVFESNDLGDHWQALPSGTELSLMGGAALPSGGAAIVGANGIVLTRVAADGALVAAPERASGVLAGVLPAADGGLLLVGENGAARHEAKP